MRIDKVVADQLFTTADRLWTLFLESGPVIDGNSPEGAEFENALNDLHFAVNDVKTAKQPNT